VKLLAHTRYFSFLAFITTIKISNFQRSILLLVGIDIPTKQTLIKIFLIMVLEKIMPKIELSSKWSCDGRELKPKLGATSQNTWIYDGRYLKPKFSATSKNTWVYDGRELKPQFSANSQNSWVIEGNKIKPQFSSNSTNTYEFNGHSILVAFGQVVLKLW